ncbi:efflux RND transporter periplasmic adaptor subunit [Serratia fonticola]|nr:efflux RND transporter periplasmic adaptor subunit [Serratia fonticola]NTZ11997.1 efflux RND transporter periplasmic adaptor subunit [Serratia fonticola]
MTKPLFSCFMTLWLLAIATPIVAAPLPAVTVALIEQSQPERALHYLGRVEAIQTVEVKTRTEGFIAKRPFTEGQMVKAGDLLYEIEPALHHSAVAQAQAQLDSATATANLAQVNLTRLQQLGNNRAVSRADIDAAAAERDTSRAAVAQARALLNTQQLQLSYTRIYAPIAGRIGHSRFHVGSLVNAASGALVNIIQLDPIRVAISINERDYITAAYQRQHGEGKLAEGQFSARLELANGKSYPEPGTFESVDNQIDAHTGTVTLRTRFANPNHLLLPGGVVNVILTAEQPQTVTLVPIAALQQNQQGHFVLVVTPENIVEVREVTLGEQHQQYYQVNAGLKAGEKVIISGVQHVRPGMQVNAILSSANAQP